MKIYHQLLVAACIIRCTLHTLAQTTCTSVMPYANMQYLTSTQLSTFQLTDPCSITCQAGFYGEFCEPNTKYAEIPQGPWNLRGYYTVGTGILKSMTLDVSTLTQVSYTNSDSTLVGIYRQQLPRSTVVLVSLTSRNPKTVFSAPTGGYIDALQVRLGMIFVAMSLSSSGPYFISVLSEDPLTGVYSATQFMPIQYRASMIEIVQNKGMNTSFIYTIANKIFACTPDQMCKQWYTGSGVTGMVCGIDCPSSLYISVTQNIMRLTDNSGVIQASTLISHATNVNCLASVPSLNTLLYRVGNNVRQYSSTATKTSIYDALLTLAVPTSAVCSLDVSESGAQILLIENGAVNTLEALQQPCEYGMTSQAVSSTSSSACVPCPTPPTNAYLVIGSPICQWQCYQGFTRTVSQCVSEPPPPCSAGYIATSYGACIPSRLPWAAAGSYVSAIYATQVRSITPAGMSNVIFPIKVAAGGGISFMTTQQSIYMSTTFGASWQAVSTVLSLTATSQCGINTNNLYNMLGYHDTLLFVGFTLRGITPTQHCLWALNTTSVAATNQLRLVQYWAISGKLCSAASDNLQSVYLLFCNTHYILKTSFAGERPIVFAGQTRAGYADGDVQSSWFSSPSSLLLHNKRLYVTDRGNCVIREIDTMRGTTGVVAGKVGVCQLQDGVESGLAGPYLLTQTLHDGFLLFLDQGSSDTVPILRQFHTTTGSVQTVTTSLLAKVSAILNFVDRIQLTYGEDANSLYDIQASFSTCPNGTMSLEGNAFAEQDCVACGNGFYSIGRACVPCSKVTCLLAGQMYVSCTGNSDSYCGKCFNKPSNRPTNYTGPASAYDSGSDCPWIYTPPCPVATYSASVSGVFIQNQSAVVCVNCPPWSNSSVTGLTNVRQCVCLGGGTLGTDNTCSIPSPYTVMPSECGALSDCTAHTYNPFPFPISTSCTYSLMDTPLGVCRCQPGEYISQIYPKQCDACPAYLYSPDGESCIRCPPYGEPSLDRSTCRCAAGTKDVNLAENAIECICEAGNGFSVEQGCYKCPENHYSSTSLTLGMTPWTQIKECLPCSPGTWAIKGATECVACPNGTFRDDVLLDCTQCPKGQYAIDPTSGSSCVDCTTECGGRQQTPCPTDSTRYICVDCPPPRANSVLNGLDDCATSCIDTFYELDGECTKCAVFNEVTCPAGSVLIPCAAYSDAACVPCANATKPLYYSRWVGTEEGKPSTSCAWECENGFAARSSAWVGDGTEIWTCAKESAWSFFDIFTI